MSEENLSCSFWGLSKLQTKVLVAGQDAHICDQCIEQAFSILEKMKAGEIHTYSLLTGNSYTLKQLVATVERVLNKSIFINWGVRGYRDREVMNLPYQSYNKLPGWEPMISLDDGIFKVMKKHSEI